MSYSFDPSNPLVKVHTSTGHPVILEMVFGSAQFSGVSILVAAAGVSLIAVFGLLVVLGISAYKTMRTPNVHRFMRSHVVVYLISLLLCDVISAIGSLMNGRWISVRGVQLGAFCTSQGALKNTGSVGTALWSMVIAIHTFCLLVLKWKPRYYVLYATLFVVWSFTGLVVIIGPAAVQNMADRGPYFGVAGYWCWITEEYAVQRLTLEYFWMFLSAFISFMLYSLVFLSLRGNIIISGGRLRIRLRRTTSTWESQTGKDSPEGQTTSLAKQMLVYPVAYTAIILPMAISRFLEWAGHEIPFEVTIFADTVFLLSGLVNVILFTTTRKIISARQARSLFSRTKSPEFDLESQASNTHLVTPYVVEKVTVSPIDSDHYVSVVPVSVPVPAVQMPRQGRHMIPMHSAPMSRPVVPNHTEKPERKVALPPLPVPKPSAQANRAIIRQSVITPLNVVKKSSLRRPKNSLMTPLSESDEGDLGQRDSWSEDSHSRYSGSSYHSTTPALPSRPLPPVPLTTRYYHSKSPSSSSTGSNRAPGTRF